MFNYRKYLFNYVLLIAVMLGAIASTFFIRQLTSTVSPLPSQNGLTCLSSNCSDKQDFNRSTTLDINVNHLPEGLDQT